MVAGMGVPVGANWGEGRGVLRLADADLGRIRPLFAQVFGGSISEGLLHWKYGNGRGVSWCLCASDGDSVGLHCGVMFREVVFRGRLRRAAQLVDLMAMPKRQGLARGNSDFALLMRHVLSTLPEFGVAGGFAFGFPSGRAMRLGEIAGVYRAVDDWQQLRFSAQPWSRRAPHIKALTADDGTCVAACDRLWPAMRADFADAALGVRDGAYFVWRYFERPDQSYVVLRVRSPFVRRLLGMVALSVRGGEGEILDVLGRQQDLPRLVNAARHWAHAEGIRCLTMMLTQRFVALFKPWAEACESTQFRIMANPWMHDPAAAEMHGAWWLTGGDTDYR